MSKFAKVKSLAAGQRAPGVVVLKFPPLWYRRALAHACCQTMSSRRTSTVWVHSSLPPACRACLSCDRHPQPLQSDRVRTSPEPARAFQNPNVLAWRSKLAVISAERSSPFLVSRQLPNTVRRLHMNFEVGGVGRGCKRSTLDDVEQYSRCISG